MKLQLQFQLEVETDWHINAGYGFGTQIDAVIERDADGIAIINGSTLKGLFRDALYDLAQNMLDSAAYPIKSNLWANVNEAGDLPDLLLGSADAESKWVFDAARPADMPTITNRQHKTGEDDAVVIAGVRIDPRTKHAQNNKFYTRELGKAASFRFTISGILADDKNAALEDIEWLTAAAAYIQRLGNRRRRGTGRCRIMLVDGVAAASNSDVHERVLRSFEQRNCGTVPKIQEQGELDTLLTLFTVATPTVDNTHQGRRYRVILYAERPIVIAQKPEAGNAFQGGNIIPGQTMRGALAALIDPASLGDADYATFKRLFVFGGASFSNLTPLEYRAEKGHLMAEMPLGLQRVGDSYISIFKEQREDKPYTGWHYLHNGMGELRPQALRENEIRIHVSIDPDLKRADDGELYSYVAIPAGTYFAGELNLTDENWSALANLLHTDLETKFELRIGKGRNRGYGRCRAWIEPINDEEQTPPLWINMPLSTRVSDKEAAEAVIVTLASDLILLDQWGRAIQEFNPQWISELLGVPAASIDAEKLQVATRTRLIESFDVLSGLPRWRDMGLVRGSSAKITFRQPMQLDLKHLQTMEVTGVGLRKGEGYGRIIFNHPAHTNADTSTGFLPPLTSVARLQPDFATGSLTVGEFGRWWRQLLEAGEILGFANLENENRTVARLLVQHRPKSTDEAKAILQLISKNAQPGRDDRFAKYPDKLEVLLRKLEAYPEHWHRGIVMLAEALLKVQLL